MAAFTANTTVSSAQSTLYRSDAFVITDTSVRQGRFEAVARSRDTIVSNYPRSDQEFWHSWRTFQPGTEQY